MIPIMDEAGCDRGGCGPDAGTRRLGRAGRVQAHYVLRLVAVHALDPALPVNGICQPVLGPVGAGIMVAAVAGLCRGSPQSDVRCPSRNRTTAVVHVLTLRDGNASHP